MSVITNQLDCLSEVLQDFCTKYDLPEISADDILYGSSDNELIAVDNTNGVGIITATYSDPNVTLRLQTPSGGFTTSLPMPFQIGDRVFVENIGVS